MKAQEMRDLAAVWLAETYPGSVIVPELSVADYGGALIDLAAITETHIVGIEIKGEGDSPARLDRQGLSYGMVAKEMWLLADTRIQGKCFARRPSGWGRLEVWDGSVRPFNRATKRGDPVEIDRYNKRYPSIRDDSRYAPDTARIGGHLTPVMLCGTLWRDELYAIARVNDLSTGGRSATVGTLTEAICQQLPVNIIHDEMIRCLRSRVWKFGKKVIDTRSASSNRDEGQQSLAVFAGDSE